MEQNVNGDNLGQVFNANTVNINNGGNDNVDTRPIVPAQRKSLNNLISDIEGYGDLSARDIWLKLHALLGVCSINEITVSQFEKAEIFLNNELEKTINKVTCKKLMASILNETKAKLMRDKTNRYSQQQHGSSDYRMLNKVQLQDVLCYVRNQNINKTDKEVKTTILDQTITLFKTQPMLGGVLLIAGVVIGKILF